MIMPAEIDSASSGLKAEVSRTSPLSDEVMESKIFNLRQGLRETRQDCYLAGLSAQADAGCESKIKELNNLWGQFKPLKPENKINDTNLKNYAYKTEILKTLIELDKNNKCFVLDTVSKPSTEAIKTIYDKIKNGTVKKLYNTLTSESEWQLKRIEISIFLKILSREKENFYLQKENIETLKQKLNISRKLTWCRYTKIETLSELFYPLEIFRHNLGYLDLHEFEKFIQNTVVQEVVLKYFSYKACSHKSNEKTERTIYFNELVGLVKYDFIQMKEFLVLAETLEVKYKFVPKDIEYLVWYIYAGRADIKKLTKKADENTVLASFENLSKSVKYETARKAHLFLLAANYSDIPVYETLEEMRFHPDYSDTLCYFLNTITHNESLMKNVKNKKFRSFFNKVIQEYSNYFSQEVYNIAEISELFDETEKNPRLFNSEMFKYIYDYFRKETGNKYPDITILLPILKITKAVEELSASGTCEQKFEVFRRKIEKVAQNSFNAVIRPYFISRAMPDNLLFFMEILKDENLKKEFHDREKMLAELQEMYNAYPPIPRTELIDAAYLEETKTEDNEDEVNEKIKKIESSYTERPCLKHIPDFYLLKLYILKKSLESPEFLDRVGKIALKDLTDKTSEYIGNVSLKKGLCELYEMPVFNQSDYACRPRRFSGSSFCTWHAHFIAPAPKLCGPSGSDIKTVVKTNIPDLVMTLKKYKDDSTIIVNFDFYFVHLGKAYIVDLGDREVELSLK